MVDAIADILTQPKRIKRPNFSAAFRRKLAEESFDAGASATLIASEHAINANLLFKWRRHYLAGDFGMTRVPSRIVH